MRADKDPAAERILRRLMDRAGVKGDPRDWAVVSGDTLLDARQMYRLNRSATREPTLIHKRDLHKLVGSALAGTFWHRKLGIRLGGPHHEDSKRESTGLDPSGGGVGELGGGGRGQGGGGG